MNVIEVKGLSKKYRIGKAEKRADTITGTLVNALKSPLRNLRQIGNLSRLDRDEDSVFWALRDVSFEVKQGEVLGIIGHNGAGKSTLLKILSRITEPTAGEVRISGRVAALLEVGTGFHPELTGRENIYMNGTILGMRKKEIDTRLDEIVAFSGVETYLDTPVKFYSSGMRVRLGFSVAAHLEPEILIIDEVLAVGDAEFQRKCLGKMEAVSRQGRTVLFVSHNMEAVRSLCQKGLLLKQGKLHNYGEANNVVDAYLTEYSMRKGRSIFAPSEQPGTNDIKLREAGVSSGKEDILTTESKIMLEFVFEAHRAVKDFNLSLILWTSSGNCVFNAISTVVNLNPGIYRACMTIPGNLLNDAVYSVELCFVSNFSVLFKVEDIIVFEVLDAPRDILWFGKWKGVIRPKLDFEINRL